MREGLLVKMDVKVCSVVFLLSAIATENVFAAVSGTVCPNGDNDCNSIEYAVCDTVPTTKVCKCKDGYKENNNQCEPELDSVCTTSDKCADANAACTDTDSNGGTCKCSSGFKDNPCVAKGLNDVCTVTSECSGVNHAVCSGDGKCSCDTGYAPRAGACDPALNQPCTTAGSCATDNAECIDTTDDTTINTCKCVIGFKDNDAGDACVTKGLNDACTDTSECSGVNNAVCSGDSKCSCDTGYVPNEGACDQVLTDIVCTENGDCPGNAICNADKTCECDMDFTLQDNQCAGAASTKAMVWMMLSSLLIFVVDKLLM